MVRVRADSGSATTGYTGGRNGGQDRKVCFAPSVDNEANNRRGANGPAHLVTPSPGHLSATTFVAQAAPTPPTRAHKKVSNVTCNVSPLGA